MENVGYFLALKLGMVGQDSISESLTSVYVALHKK